MDLPQEPTLTLMVQILVRRAKKPLCLIVDEAQHMLTTQGGLDMTYDLKAARDALNQKKAS